MPSETEPPEQEPRIPIRNIWYLLLYAWDLGRFRDRWSCAAEAAPNLLGLLAQILAESVQPLLRRQLGREFDTTTSELCGLRGKVRLSASVRRLSFESGRAVCSYPELSVDTPRNRILRSTLFRLLHDPQLKQGAGKDSFLTLRETLWAGVRAMDGVSLIRVQGSDFSRIRLGRNDRLYELPIAICRLIYSLQLPTRDKGDGLVQALFRDEMVFWKLFENFVRNFYGLHLGEHTVQREYLSWHDEGRSSFVPRMETDTTIVTRSEPRRRVVVETKYYPSHLSERLQGSEKFLPGNLYQLYAYLRTQEERGPEFRDARGILLYPCVDRPCDERLKVQGHLIWVCTLDLGLPWQEIETRLLFMADRALADDCGGSRDASSMTAVTG